MSLIKEPKNQLCVYKVEDVRSEIHSVKIANIKDFWRDPFALRVKTVFGICMLNRQYLSALLTIKQSLPELASFSCSTQRSF